MSSSPSHTFEGVQQSLPHNHRAAVQVDILDLQPRRNPATGRTYGSNTAASWGYQYLAGFLDGDTREVVTIYEVPSPLLASCTM